MRTSRSRGARGVALACSLWALSLAAEEPSSAPAPGPASAPTNTPASAPLDESAPASAPAPLLEPAPASAPTSAPVPVKAPSKPSTSAQVSAAPGKGLTVKTADGSFAMTVRARLQMRETVASDQSADEPEATSELNIRTVRLVTQGHVRSEELRYSVQLAFGPAEFDAATPTPLFDAWLEYKWKRDLSLRAGQYFVPFDRARTVREFALQLIDRQQVVSEFNLDRDVGVTAFSNDLFGQGERLSYALGIFGGAGRNRTSGDPLGFLYMARVGYRPMGAFDDDAEGDLSRERRARLALGAAVAYNQETNRSRSTTGATYTLGGFDYLHAAADLVFKYAGISFLGEVMYRSASEDSHTQASEDGDLQEFSRSGWGYVTQAGVMVSEKVEVAARWDQLFAAAGTDPALVRLADERGRELGAGVNLYLNGHLMKLQADYSARYGKETAPLHLARLQLDVTF